MRPIFALSLAAALGTALCAGAAGQTDDPVVVATPDTHVRVVQGRNVRVVQGRNAYAYVTGDDPDEGEVVVARAGGRRGFLGVDVVDITSELRSHFGAPADAGLLVSKIEPDSPAARAGIQVGDVITAVDGKPLRSSWDLRRAIAPHGKGDTANLTVVRDRREQRLRAEITERQARIVELNRLVRRGPKGKLVVVPGDPGDFGDLGDLGNLGDLSIDLGDLGKNLDVEIGDSVANALETLSDPAIKQRIDAAVLARERAQRADLERQLRAMEKRLEELEKRLH